MKKKLVTIIVMLITCVTFVFGLAACNKDGETPVKDAQGRTNWLTTVFEPMSKEIGGGCFT